MFDGYLPPLMAYYPAARHDLAPLADAQAQVVDVFYKGDEVLSVGR